MMTVLDRLSSHCQRFFKLPAAATSAYFSIATAHPAACQSLPLLDQPLPTGRIASGRRKALLMSASPLPTRKCHLVTGPCQPGMTGRLLAFLLRTRFVNMCLKLLKAHRSKKLNSCSLQAEGRLKVNCFLNVQ